MSQIQICLRQSYPWKVGLGWLTFLLLWQTLWTTNLFEVKGEKNWHVFLTASLLLTMVVLVCWVVYGRISRKREEARWPPRARAGANMLSLNSPV